MAKIGEIRDRVQQLEEERNDQLRVRQLEEQVGWHRAVSISSKLARVRYDDRPAKNCRGGVWTKIAATSDSPCGNYARRPILWKMNAVL